MTETFAQDACYAQMIVYWYLTTIAIIIFLNNFLERDDEVAAILTKNRFHKAKSLNLDIWDGNFESSLTSNFRWHFVRIKKSGRNHHLRYFEIKNYIAILAIVSEMRIHSKDFKTVYKHTYMTTRISCIFSWNIGKEPVCKAPLKHCKRINSITEIVNLNIDNINRQSYATQKWYHSSKKQNFLSILYRHFYHNLRIDLHYIGIFRLSFNFLKSII